MPPARSHAGDSTVDDPSTPGAGSTASPAADGPWLTILHHPDGRRVGESTRLDGLRQGLPVALSRNKPEFAQRDGSRRGLEHKRLSRTPVWLAVQDEALSITASRSDLRITVQDQPLREPCRIAWSEVREVGVFITLGGCILVWVHEHAIDRTGLAEHGMLGVSAGLVRVREAIERIAPLSTPVLIRGESGVGKELVARALYELGRRNQRPWVAINIAALPSTTAASALFGHSRGAFTGANQTHAGFFASAEGGTLFLDEIGELAGDIQPLLLRALENHEIQPVGGATRAVDVRVIAATDADLEQLVASGRFRRALLHRLQAATIDVPPLRARKADIPLLLHHFLRLHLRDHDATHLLDSNDEQPKQREWLRLSLITELMRHDFPGNVRELHNIAARIATHGHDRPRAELPDALAQRVDVELLQPTPSAPGPRDDISPERLAATLREHEFNVSRSARALGISNNTLRARIREIGGVRLASDLTREEIEQIRGRVGSDIDRQAEALEVSAHGLRLRIRQLGLR